jgi:hypothetical protein
MVTRKPNKEKRKMAAIKKNTVLSLNLLNTSNALDIDPVSLVK